MIYQLKRTKLHLIFRHLNIKIYYVTFLTKQIIVMKRIILCSLLKSFKTNIRCALEQFGRLLSARIPYFLITTFTCQVEFESNKLY